MRAANDVSGTNKSTLAATAPIMAAVFIAFLVIGLALPVLPLHVHDGLGLSTFAVDLVAGSSLQLRSSAGSGPAIFPTAGIRSVRS
jgi:hypothetical protein